MIARTIEHLHGKKVKQVTCGGFHSAAITETGALYTCMYATFHFKPRVAAHSDCLVVNDDIGGGGEHGQLGHGDKINKTIPCLVEALADKLVVQITCGWSHTVVLTDTGEVYTFGNGDHGKLGTLDNCKRFKKDNKSTHWIPGHNRTTKLTLPKKVEALVSKRIISVASYNEHSVALSGTKVV